MNFSKHLKQKLTKQLSLVQTRIGMLGQIRHLIIGFLQKEIPRQAQRLKVGCEKVIPLDYGNMPSEVVSAIRGCGLDRRIWLFHTFRFEGDAGLAHVIEDFENTMYNCINYLAYAIKLAHPEAQLGDDFESHLKNVERLHPDIARAAQEGIVWIKSFKEQRRVTAHRSPKTYYIQFQARVDPPKADLVLCNNENEDQQDLSELLELAPKVEVLFYAVKHGIDKLLKLDEGGKGS